MSEWFIVTCMYYIMLCHVMLVSKFVGLCFIVGKLCLIFHQYVFTSVRMYYQMNSRSNLLSIRAVIDCNVCSVTGWSSSCTSQGNERHWE